MTTETIFNFINHNISQKGTNYLDLYNKMIKMNYSKELIELVFFIDFNTDIQDLISVHEEREKRKYQAELRVLALNRYFGKCVISGENKTKLLEVAHIKPVKDCMSLNEKKDLDNTLLLWMDIHKYFDAYQISINPNTQMIEINDKEPDNEWMDQYNGMKIRCINAKMKKYLEHHYGNFTKIKNRCN